MTDLNTPIAPDPSDPGNWREIDRLRRLAESEGRTFNPDDPYNWSGIAAGQAGAAPVTPTPAPDPAITGVTTTPGTGAAAADANRQLFAQQSAQLGQMGLGNLFSIGPDGLPSGWLWDQITSGAIRSEAQLLVNVEATQEYQQRFPVIFQMRTGVRNGAPGYVPSARDVLDYEEAVEDQLRTAGLPADFYGDRGYIQGLMGRGLSPLEVEERLGASWAMVRETSPAVLETFQEYFGLQGDGAMAALFLDPERTQGMLDRMARTAYTGGMGSTLGLNIDRVLADRIAQLPSTAAGIFQDLTTVNAMNAQGGLFTEGITETQDLTAETTGIDATVFGDGDARSAMERRLLERNANDRSSLGGAAVTQQGAVGVGTAQRR